jgi:predicted RNA-binding protein YlqC (UPF0109 family)
MGEAKDVLNLENEQEALEMLLRVTEALVDRPTDLLVEATVTDFGTTFKASPHPDDLGKLIGKSGRMARALRVILGAVAQKHGTRYVLDIVDTRRGDCVRVAEVEA